MKYGSHLTLNDKRHFASYTNPQHTFCVNNEYREKSQKTFHWTARPYKFSTFTQCREIGRVKCQL